MAATNEIKESVQMMTADEIATYQKVDREFRATEVGKLFSRFEVAAATLWQSDALDLSYGRSKRIDDAHRAAREALIAKLREIMGDLR